MENLKGLNTKRELIDFLKGPVGSELCWDHIDSGFVRDNWCVIASDCYIETKAKRLAVLLGLDDISGDDLEKLKGIVYATGKAVDLEKEKADGWFVFSPKIEGVKDGVKAELKLEGFMGESFKAGKITFGGGRWGFLPKGKRTRGYWLDCSRKIRLVA